MLRMLWPGKGVCALMLLVLALMLLRPVLMLLMGREWPPLALILLLLLSRLTAPVAARRGRMVTLRCDDHRFRRLLLSPICR